MSFLQNIQGRIKSYFDKQKEDKDLINRLQLEADFQRRQMFEQEYRQNALEVARARAKKDAASMSGLQKLRALNRSRRLNEDSPDKPSFLKNLSQYTQKNLARQEQNMKRTDEIRGEAKKMRVDKLSEQQKLRKQRLETRGGKAFGGSKW